MIKIVNESASEAIVGEDLTDPNIVASQVSLNIKGEWDAIEGYNKLIPFFENNGDDESAEVVREIIADEKAHADKLRKILVKYDGNILPED